MKKNGLKKKLALTLAVLGAISPAAGIDTLLTDFGAVAIVEASTNSSVGEVSAFAKDSDPKGYLLCDGRAVSRTEYAELFAEIGTKYGAGDGETTFNLPNLTDGRFIEGNSEAGEYKEAGLPNITGYIGHEYYNPDDRGAIYVVNYVGQRTMPAGATDLYNIAFDASKSNPIYGNSDTVQPNSLTMRYYIKATKTADGGDGKIQAGDTDTISGDTAYNELRPADGNYVKKDNTTADNLTALDSQTKANEDAIAEEAENRANADTALANRITEAEEQAKADATEKANQAKQDAINDATQRVLDAEERVKQDAADKAKQAKEDAIKDASQKVADAEERAKQDASDKASQAEANAKEDAARKVSEAEDRAKEDASNKAEQAKEEAIADASQKVAEAETRAKEEAANKAKEAEENAKADAEKRVSDAEARAKQDATDKANQAEENAKADTAQKVADAEDRAKADAESKAKAAEEAAKADASQKVSEAEARAKEDATDKANAAEANAKADATNKANAAESHAKSYTDLVTDAAKTYAQTYTDEVAKTKANVGLDNITEDGKDVIRELARTEIGNITLAIDGIDTSGDTIIVNKPMETKDIYVDGKINTTGDAEIGGNIHGKGDLLIDGDSHFKGNVEVDKNMAVHGDVILDGRFFAKEVAAFGDNVTIAKNLTVGGNSYVYGDAVVGGNVYGRSFNIGNERYIDENGINANGHKVRNVADGEIGPNSLDAVNGRQLHNSISNLNTELTGNVSEVAAGAAAMANLHPLEYNRNDKVSVSVAVGTYKDKTATAAGVFYRPNAKSMISASGSLGYNDNMFGLGYSQRFGQTSEIEGMTEEQLRDKVEELNESNKSLKGEVSELSKKNSVLESAYNALMAKVDGLMAKIGLSDTAEK